MIDKEIFYSENDYPGSAKSKKIWKSVSRQIKPSRLFSFYEMPGFYYGFASAVVLFFTFYGIYSFGNDLVYKNKPDELKLNGAYQSAIKEFESVIPAVISAENSNRFGGNLISIKMEQIKEIDTAIAELKDELKNNDLNSLKQLNLRQLYITKIKLILEVIENGEITL